MISNAKATTVHTDTSTDDAITYDAIFFTLSNARRRYVLHRLKQYDEPVSVGALAREVAAWENDVPVEAVTNVQRKRSYSALHQTHLPKMADLGIIDYDRERGVIRPTDPIADLDFYLEVIPHDSIPWHEVHLGVSSVVLALSVLVALDTYPLAGFEGGVYAVVVSAVWVVMAAVNTYYARRWRLGDDEAPEHLD